VLADPPPLCSIVVARFNNANGMHLSGQVFIDPSCSAYLSATNGDYAPLAALLAHERHHQLGGRDEAGAHRVQERVLRELREG
jgi:hypothetical protein